MRTEIMHAPAARVPLCFTLRTIARAAPRTGDHDRDGAVQPRAADGRRHDQRFALLFAELDQTTSTNAKIDAMVRYFSAAPPADAAWAVFFLVGRRLKRLLPWAAIGEWTIAPPS